MTKAGIVCVTLPLVHVRPRKVNSMFLVQPSAQNSLGDQAFFFFFFLFDCVIDLVPFTS